MKDRRMFTHRLAVLVLAMAALGLLAGSGTMEAQLLPTPTTQTARFKARKAALAVADTANNRVLLYTAPLRSNESATLVLGQPDFTHNSANQGAASPAANTLAGPSGVIQGPGGELYVADTGNCRVLRFDPPFRTDMSASLVVGEPDFVTRNCLTLTTATASSLAAPIAVALDSAGDLWVSDTFFGDRGDSRVLEYLPPFTNGMAASLAIGQTTTGASQGCNQVFAGPPHFAPATASTLCTPRGLTFDSSGDLWIADLANSRVLEFLPPFSTGMSASLVLGQPSFTDHSPNQCEVGIPGCSGPAANKLFFPTATAFDSAGDLWVADFDNDRVLEYLPPFSDDMDATLVLGQPDLNSGGTGVITGYMGLPSGLAFESTGTLLVSDEFFNRVLIFNPPFSTDMKPDGVIGQRSLRGGQPNQGKTTAAANTLDFPAGIAALR